MAQVFSGLSWGTNHLKKKECKNRLKKQIQRQPPSKLQVLHPKLGAEEPSREREKITNSGQHFIRHYVFL